MSYNNHILVAPIYNLRLLSGVNKELWIENVHLIDKTKLLKNIKKNGFPWSFGQLKRILIGKPQAALKFENIRTFFDNPSYIKADTFAIIRIAGFEEIHIAYGHKKIEEAIYILASCQLGTTKRGRVVRFGAPEYGVRILDRNLVVPATMQQSLSKGSMWVVSPVREFTLGKDYKEFKTYNFLPLFLKMISGKDISIDSGWKTCFKKAVVLAGKSVFSKEISIAFLFNMIAIETFLKRQGEEFLDVMPNRINDLFGWLYEDDQISFEKINRIVKRLYKLRNNFIHDGDNSQITIHDLIETDVILSNLLYNFCRLRKIFQNKEEIIKLSKEFEARRTLNLNLKRPKKLRFSRMQYYQKDFDNIQKRGI